MAASIGLGTTAKYMQQKTSGAAAAFAVSSEHPTGARPSVRLCLRPELARCIHKYVFGHEGRLNMFLTMKADESVSCAARCVTRQYTGLRNRRFYQPSWPNTHLQSFGTFG
jgi:hypothetical protein